MTYYVSAGASPLGKGTKESPFATIQAAAELAKAGDEILVAPGTYREAVHPRHAGTEQTRIIYRS